jgi:hypothetical protein
MVIQEFTNEAQLDKIWYWTSRLGLVVAISSVVYMLLYRAHELQFLPDTANEAIAVGLICLWTLGPACWFAFETHWLLTREDKQTKKNRMDEFKVGQDAAKAFWVAIAALLVLLYASAGVVRL